MNYTENLARLSLRSRTEESGRQIDIAKRSLLDTLGVIIAGANQPSTSTLRTSLGGDLPPGPCTVWPTGERTDAQTAALLNGTSGHALDFDDITDVQYGHPSVVLWPAILALAEQEHRTGQEAIDAFRAGFDVIIAACSLMDVREHYGQGWHASATIGILGATGAAARLRDLSMEQTRIALGLASTMASGSRQNFGTMTKPFHVGMTARNAIVAVELAAHGFTADPSELDGPLGFFARFGQRPGETPDGFLETASNQLEHEQVNVKKYPSCYNTQRTADLVLQLARENDIDPSEIRSIEVITEPGGFDPLIHHRPQTGLQAKFSMEYIIAAGLTDKRLDLFSFEDEAIRRPQVQTLMGKVLWRTEQMPPTGSPEWDFAYSVLRITTTTRTIEGRCDVPRGDRRNPLSLAELCEKFATCLDYSERRVETDLLQNAILNLNVLENVSHLAEKLPIARS